MSNNLLGAALTGAQSGIAALGQYGTSTTTTAVNYPHAHAQTNWGYVGVPPPPPFPYDHPAGCVGVFRVRKLENGYLVEWQKHAGAAITEYYAETLKDVGERVAALGVQKALEGDPK